MPPLIKLVAPVVGVAGLVTVMGVARWAEFDQLWPDSYAIGNSGGAHVPGSAENVHRAEVSANGFRSSFRDWAAERTDHPREVIEAALAHVAPNKVEAAYVRSDLFERRRLLMDGWADYLAGERHAVAQPNP